MSAERAGRRSTTALTQRDRDLFELLGRCRWLSTTQIRRRFFPGRSANAVNKRLRKLTGSGFLHGVRPTLTADCFYRLRRPARELLSDEGPSVSGGLPAHWSHFAYINDVRLWFDEQARAGLRLQAFWAEWELKAVGQSRPVVPDGVALVDAREGVAALAIEVDCGTENPRLLETKIRRYEASGLGLSTSSFRAVLVLVPGWPRLCSLIKALHGSGSGSDSACLVSDLTRLQRISFTSKAWINLSALSGDEDGQLVALSDVLGSPVGLSCREERQKAVSPGVKSRWPVSGPRVSAGAKEGDR